MKKTILSMILVVALVSSLFSAAAAERTDISGHWAGTVIAKSGFSAILDENGSFLPDKAVTRMEFVRILHKALDIRIYYFRETDIKEFFSDVENDDPGASELYDLVISDIIPRAELFRPDEPLPRDEMIHYTINALKHMTNGEYVLIRMMPAPFDDDDKIDPAYKSDVIEAVLLKIINGRGGNMLFPDAAATRAEAVVLISRLLETLKNLADVRVTAEAVSGADSMEMKLTISNNTGKPVTIRHTSGQKYDFMLFDADGNSLYTWSADRMFIMALTSTEIEPGQTVVFSEILEGDMYAAIKDRIHMMRAIVTGSSEEFFVDPEGYAYYISDMSSSSGQ